MFHNNMGVNAIRPREVSECRCARVSPYPPASCKPETFYRTDTLNNSSTCLLNEDEDRTLENSMYEVEGTMISSDTVNTGQALKGLPKH